MSRRWQLNDHDEEEEGKKKKKKKKKKRKRITGNSDTGSNNGKRLKYADGCRLKRCAGRTRLCEDRGSAEKTDSHKHATSTQ
jgi:hypothetical protein